MTSALPAEVQALESESHLRGVRSSDLVERRMQQSLEARARSIKRASDGVTLRSSVGLKTMAGWQLFDRQGAPAA